MALRVNEYRTISYRDYSGTDGRPSVACDVCDYREALVVVEHTDEMWVDHRHFVCPSCLGRFGAERVIVLLEGDEDDAREAARV